MFRPIDKDGISFSIRNGVFMPFVYKGRQIVAHNASWSVREKIWVDDELVVSKLGFSMASTHVIDVDGDKVELTFGSRDSMQEIFLEARVGGELIHEVSYRPNKSIKPSRLAMWILVGGLSGLVSGYLVGLLLRGL